MDPRIAQQQDAWAIPRLWEGQECVIIAGGPSLTQEQVNVARSSGRKTIVINSSYRLLPTADLLYFCDARWWDWHKDDPLFRDFAGIKVTLDNWVLRGKVPGLKCVRNVGQRGLSLKPGEIKNGSNSGYQCINIAVQLGVRHIYLLGYDMKYSDDGRSHWHEGHPIGTPRQVFEQLMLPQYAGLAVELGKIGVTVTNCTPGSALREFPYRNLDECLSADPHRTALQV